MRWSDDIKEFVTDALKPAIIRNIELEPAAQRVRVTVDEEELSKAIGRRGRAGSAPVAEAPLKALERVTQ